MIPHGLVDQLKDTQTEMIGMKPKDAIVLEEVPLVDGEVYPEEDKLPEDGLYQYLLEPGEEHDDQRRRATDRIWSKKTYRLREVMENPGNRLMYYLKDGVAARPRAHRPMALIEEHLHQKS